MVVQQQAGQGGLLTPLLPSLPSLPPVDTLPQNELPHWGREDLGERLCAQHPVRLGSGEPLRIWCMAHLAFQNAMCILKVENHHRWRGKIVKVCVGGWVCDARVTLHT